jgi:hypothetical protein
MSNSTDSFSEDEIDQNEQCRGCSTITTVAIWITVVITCIGITILIVFLCRSSSRDVVYGLYIVENGHTLMIHNMNLEYAKILLHSFKNAILVFRKAPFYGCCKSKHYDLNSTTPSMENDFNSSYVCEIYDDVICKMPQ